LALYDKVHYNNRLYNVRMINRQTGQVLIQPTNGHGLWAQASELTSYSVGKTDEKTSTKTGT
jgi:hypothetical protein